MKGSDHCFDFWWSGQQKRSSCINLASLKQWRTCCGPTYYFSWFNGLFSKTEGTIIEDINCAVFWWSGYTTLPCFQGIGKHTCMSHYSVLSDYSASSHIKQWPSQKQYVDLVFYVRGSTMLREYWIISPHALSQEN